MAAQTVIVIETLSTETSSAWRIGFVVGLLSFECGLYALSPAQGFEVLIPAKNLLPINFEESITNLDGFARVLSVVLLQGTIVDLLHLQGIWVNLDSKTPILESHFNFIDVGVQ
jgi:hypothetical protein